MGTTTPVEPVLKSPIRLTRWKLGVTYFLVALAFLLLAYQYFLSPISLVPPILLGFVGVFFLSISILPYVARKKFLYGQRVFSRIFLGLGSLMFLAGVGLTALIYLRSIGNFGGVSLPVGTTQGPLQWETIVSLYNQEGQKKDAFLPIASIQQCEGGSVRLYQIGYGCCDGPLYPPIFNDQLQEVSKQWIANHAYQYRCTENILPKALIRSGKAVDPNYYNIIVDQGIVFVGTNYRTIVALKTDSGGVLWETTLNDYQSGNIVADSGNLYIPIAKKSVLAIRKSDGTPVWERNYQLPSTRYSNTNVPFGAISMLQSGNLLLWVDGTHASALIVDIQNGNQVASLTNFRTYSDIADIITYSYTETKPSDKPWPNNSPIPIAIHIISINSKSGVTTSVVVKTDADLTRTYVIVPKDDPLNTYLISDLGENKYALYSVNPNGGTTTKLWERSIIERIPNTTLVSIAPIVDNLLLISNQIGDELEAVDVYSGETVFTVKRLEDGTCEWTGQKSEKIRCLPVLKYATNEELNFHRSNFLIYFQSGDYHVFNQLRFEKQDQREVSIYTNNGDLIWRKGYSVTKFGQPKVSVAGKAVIFTNTDRSTSIIEVYSLTNGQLLFTGSATSIPTAVGSNDNLYFINRNTDGGGTLEAIDLTVGQARWSKTIGRELAGSQLSGQSPFGL